MGKGFGFGFPPPPAQGGTQTFAGGTGSGVITSTQAWAAAPSFAATAMPPAPPPIGTTTTPTTPEAAAQTALQNFNACSQLRELDRRKNVYNSSKTIQYACDCLKAGTMLQNSQAYKAAANALSALPDQDSALATSLRNAIDLVPKLPYISPIQIQSGIQIRLSYAETMLGLTAGIKSWQYSKDDVQIAIGFLWPEADRAAAATATDAMFAWRLTQDQLVDGIKSGKYSKDDVQIAIAFMPEANRAAATSATNAVFVSFANTLSDAKSTLQTIRNLMFGENGVVRDYNKALNMINGLKSSLQDAGNPLKLQQESAVVNLNVIGALSNGIDANNINNLLNSLSVRLGGTAQYRSISSNGTSFALDPGKIGTRNFADLEAKIQYVIDVMRDKLGGIVIGNTYIIDMSEFQDYIDLSYKGKQMVINIGSVGGQPYCTSKDHEFGGLITIIGTKLSKMADTSFLAKQP